MLHAHSQILACQTRVPARTVGFGRIWGLAVTMDDATNEIYPAFLSGRLANLCSLKGHFGYTRAHDGF